MKSPQNLIVGVTNILETALMQQFYKSNKSAKTISLYNLTLHWVYSLLILLELIISTYP